MFASRIGSDACVRALVEAGADVNIQDARGRTAIFSAYADTDSDAKCARELLKAKADVNHVCKEGDTALMFMSALGHTNGVLELIRADASVSAKTDNGFTSLMQACLWDRGACAMYLIDANADVNQADQYGMTCLMNAARFGSVECVGLLTKHTRTVLDATDENGVTALMYACSSGQDRCALALLEAGASVDVVDHNLNDAFAFACKQGKEECIRLLMSYMAHEHNRVPFDWEPQSLLMRRLSGSMREWVCTANNCWSTPLHFVCVNSPGRTRSLLRSGADILAARDGGPTPLDLASREGEGSDNESASLILRANEAWSSQTHDIFPSPSRRRAYEVFKIGILLSSSPLFRGEEQALRDVWRSFVMPYAITRHE
jgi:serine/threonine-protein phosphatase 6 regulatory ankyrin repeat subunit B